VDATFDEFELNLNDWQEAETTVDEHDEFLLADRDQDELIEQQFLPLNTIEDVKTFYINRVFEPGRFDRLVIVEVLKSVQVLFFLKRFVFFAARLCWIFFNALKTEMFDATLCWKFFSRICLFFSRKNWECLKDGFLARSILGCGVGMLSNVTFWKH
jgi:hypothetical protein